MARPLSRRSRALGGVGALVCLLAATVLDATGHGVFAAPYPYLWGFIVCGFGAGFSASLAMADRFGNQSSFGWSVFMGVCGIFGTWLLVTFWTGFPAVREGLEMPKLWPLLGAPR